MKVYSIFNSIDGEVNTCGGQGRFSTFIRLAGCNLRCSYCDTKYAQDPYSGKEMTHGQIIKEVQDIGCKKVTITGGEPLSQYKDLKNLVFMLSHRGITISIETNGSLVVPSNWPVDCWVVDYKLPGSMMYGHMNEDYFLFLSERDIIKFVISSAPDFIVAVEKIKNLKHFEARSKFAMSPVISEFWTAKDLISAMQVEKLVDVQVNIQLHKFIWPECGEGEEH